MKQLYSGRWHLSVLLGFSILVHSCSGDQRGGKIFRIAVGQFMHETCTFCPEPTGIDAFEHYGPPLEGAEVLESNEYIRGFAAMAGEIGGVELTGLCSPRDARGGSSGSWITGEAFDKYASLMVRDINDRGPFDAVYLALHGAMAVTGIDRPEAELVRRLREAAGEVPVFITYDLHANEDEAIAEVADAVFITKRYPHYDAYAQGERAARVLIQTLKGRYVPSMAVRRPGVITPSVVQGTGVSPAMEIMERARRWEDRIPGAYVSVAFGFAYADVPDAGACVMAVTNNDPELAAEIAEDMSGFIWRMRKDFAGRHFPKTAEGVSLAISAAREGKTPVIIADHSDRTGNSTHILEELIHQGAEKFCIATISDEKALDEISSRGLKAGDEIEIYVGGYADSFAGKPVLLKGILEYFDRYRHFTRLAVVRFGQGNRVILTPELHQVTTPGIFSDLGIGMDQIGIISLKSRVHFRRGFHETGLAGAIIEVDAPGLGPADLTTIPYRNIPRNLYPVYLKE